MMQMLRKAAVFVMFAVLIGAFAISMGGNNYFDRYTHPTVAKVGSVDITPQDFERAYQRDLDNLSARAGRRITIQQARAVGLPEQVLRGLIQDAALDYEAQKLGLGLSKDGLRASLTSNDVFQDSSGKFSPEKYESFLQRIGYSAPVFEHEYRSDIVRRQLQSVFKTSGIVTPVMLDAFNRYLNEERTLSYFTIGAPAVGKIEAPADDALKSFYEERKNEFMAPELRKVSVIAISPQIVEKRISVPEAELKAEYDAKAAHYSVPERRAIELIPFQSKEAAEKASSELSSGKTFQDVAKAVGFKSGDITLGTVSRKEFTEKFDTNEAVLKTAFDLKKGEVSKPVDGPLSWVIIRVSDIVPGQEKTFDEVKDRVREDLVKAKSTAESSKLIKAFEDDRASGVPLSETAKKLNLPLEEVTINQGGNGPDGKPVKLDSVPAPTLAAAVFKSDIGVENEALRLPGGGYAWFDIQDIVKARQKPFDEVKAEVEVDWQKEQLRTKLAEKARELLASIDHGQPMAEAAKSVGAEVKNSKPLKRQGSEQGLPQTAITQAFSLAEGGSSSAASADGSARTIFQVAKVTPAGPLNETARRSLRERLSGEIANDNFAEFLTGIEKKAGVSIDRKNFADVAGGGGSFETEE